MLDHGCGLEVSLSWVRRQFLADTRASKLKGNTGTLTKRCILLMKFLAVSDANKLTVIFFFAVVLRPNAGHGLLILEVSRSHTTTHYIR